MAAFEFISESAYVSSNLDVDPDWALTANHFACFSNLTSETTSLCACSKSVQYQQHQSPIETLGVTTYLDDIPNSRVLRTAGSLQCNRSRQEFGCCRQLTHPVPPQPSPLHSVCSRLQLSLPIPSSVLRSTLTNPRPHLPGPDVLSRSKLSFF
ncbi:hypothetical protein BV25DRAFT_1921977 [Artomyces pyxidatus]|uniref:Uncharacterized protein n=1 Tax=Artomyces pyxidatus TaxID=48021 RepID=A0ACB8SGA4_9AGAM|nr:hypothetical protein BV25DRAFT_1921977 [Artomyces pyxidatus]